MSGEAMERTTPLSPEERAKRYWIEGGVKVRIKGGYGPVMTVMRVLTVSRLLRNGERKTFIQGVLCSYTDPFDGSEVKKRFHTKELQPA